MECVARRPQPYRHAILTNQVSDQSSAFFGSREHLPGFLQPLHMPIPGTRPAFHEPLVALKVSHLGQSGRRRAQRDSIRAERGRSARLSGLSGVMAL